MIIFQLSTRKLTLVVNDESNGVDRGVRVSTVACMGGVKVNTVASIGVLKLVQWRP